MFRFRFSLKRLAFLALTVYILISFYSGFWLLSSKLKSYAVTDSDTLPKTKQQGFENIPRPPIIGTTSSVNVVPLNSSADKIVEVWSKAAIGDYLWQHILQGEVDERIPGIWSYGSIQISNIKFRLRTGPGVVPEKVPQGVQHLVIVLNGRTDAKIAFARIWLDSISNLPSLKSATLVLLGNERCENEWVQNYMRREGGPLDATLIVYDAPEAQNDDRFYQWPLGVATYRGFPHVNPKLISLDRRRPYSCNFVGTVYPNFSRVDLLGALRRYHNVASCLVKARTSWTEGETATSLATYIGALRDSDLTLCPVGKNAESYRIYEAMSYGSVPVIEDSRTPGQCASSFYLLKKHSAPVIWVKNWTADLKEIFEKEQKLTLEDKFLRRKLIVTWYEEFKSRLKKQFVGIVQKQAL